MNEQEITHPEYESGLKAVLEANPKKTLLFHATRFGTVNPIKFLKPRESWKS